jgi:hypothetical protein
LNLGEPTPQINDQTDGNESLLTTKTFLVATTAGNSGSAIYDAYGFYTSYESALTA